MKNKRKVTHTCTMIWQGKEYELRVNETANYYTFRKDKYNKKDGWSVVLGCTARLDLSTLKKIEKHEK
ncbi:hypothetical protein [Sulfurospirillum multivorans]|uniref:hypothetical protein n=1 Tax=Sulfurospirillum multivorans TaxID=66821 RepID=UPI00046CBD63|nr:hypothetical protein [Sulfurospirillum multivorans]